MKIAIFNSLEEAQAKLDYYNNLTKHATSSSDYSLTSINQHTIDPIFWFNFSDCLNNCGLTCQIIIDDEINNIILEFNSREDLVLNGYLPQPLGGL